MLKIKDFDKSHIEEAKKLALMNYDEERSAVNELPQIDNFPDLKCFADNGLGVSVFDGNNMIGYLCCHDPHDNAFNSMAKGVFSPIYGHGAVSNNRNMIYKKLYQAAACKWIKHKITYHAIALYAHDDQAINAFFTYGFGLRCMDAIRQMTNLKDIKCEGIAFNELAKINIEKIREMRRLLARHLSKSPCFMYSSPEKLQNWLNRAESRDSRVFIAEKNEQIIAFIEVMDDGENFVSDTDGIKNICGAYCLGEFRGTGISQGLLDYAITRFREEGYKTFGVDFESFNPTANGFWLKYFKPYTNSLVRRIDECALDAPDN